MENRSIWLTILLLVLAGVVKAQWHFIKLAALGGMGLGGLWMMHKLAQDFNKIRNPKPAAAKLFSKRSVEDNSIAQIIEDSFEMNYSSNLHADPLQCAQLMVCYMAATPMERLGKQEADVLKMLRRHRTLNPSEDVYQKAALVGSRAQGAQSMCSQEYPLCPYSRLQIAHLMHAYLV